MTDSGAYSDACTAYTTVVEMLPADTVAQISDMISRSWIWEPPKPSPEIHEPPSMPMVIAPHIQTRRCKPFSGHNFRLGGNKE